MRKPVTRSVRMGAVAMLAVATTTTGWMTPASGTAVSPPPAQSVQAPVTPQQFRGGADTVALYVAVTDPKGELVTDLTQAHFEVLDDGTPRDITVFSAEAQPVTAVLMLDMNGSTFDVPWLQHAGEALIAGLQPRDRLRIGSFGDEVMLSPMLTGDPRYLAWVLREELWPASASPLWQAVDAAMTSLDRESGRRVILLLTNGIHLPRDLGRGPRPGDLARRAEAAGHVVYAVGFQNGTFDRSITNLVASSGGRVRRVKDLSEAGAAFASILRELHAQYLIGFTPAALDGRTHAISVRVRRPGLTVTTRQRYLAGPR